MFAFRDDGNVLEMEARMSAGSGTERYPLLLRAEALLETELECQSSA